MTLAGRPYRQNITQKDPAYKYNCFVCGQRANGWDHCHTHGIIRGPLCQPHNSALRYIDSQQVVYSADYTKLIEYRRLCPECLTDNDSNLILPHPDVTTSKLFAIQPTAKYTARINLTTTPEQLTDLRVASATDRIEVTARLRAMITLWETDERHRKRVDKLALECR